MDNAERKKELEKRKKYYEESFENLRQQKQKLEECEASLTNGINRERAVIGEITRGWKGNAAASFCAYFTNEDEMVNRRMMRELQNIKNNLDDKELELRRDAELLEEEQKDFSESTEGASWD